MLRLLRFADLDLARWNACVAATPGPPPDVAAWLLAATARPGAPVVEQGPGRD